MHSKSKSHDLKITLRFFQKRPVKLRGISIRTSHLSTKVLNQKFVKALWCFWAKYKRNALWVGLACGGSVCCNTRDWCFVKINPLLYLIGFVKELTFLLHCSQIYPNHDLQTRSKIKFNHLVTNLITTVWQQTEYIIPP